MPKPTREEAIWSYAQHLHTCPARFLRAADRLACTCGLDEVLTAPRAEPTSTPRLADYEEFNREQRVRRAAAVDSLCEVGTFSDATEAAEFAAKRYPLKRRVPRVVSDPHDAGNWRVYEDGSLQFRGAEETVWTAPEDEAATLLWTPERIRKLAELLDAPYEWQDDTSVELVP